MKVLHFSLNKHVHIPHAFSLHSELSFANVSKHWNSINSFLYISCGAYLKKNKSPGNLFEDSGESFGAERLELNTHWKMPNKTESFGFNKL